MIRPPPRSPLFPYTPLSRSPLPPPLPASRSASARRSWPRRPRSACCQRYPCAAAERAAVSQRYRLRRSEEHTSELQSRLHLVCRLLLEKKKTDAKHFSQL